MIDERFQVEILRASRNRLYNLIEATTADILFKIPDGFNNNIMWQIGHCITSQQRHMYMRSGLPMHISKDFMEHFKIGSAAIYHEAEHSGTINMYLKLLSQSR